MGLLGLLKIQCLYSSFTTIRKKLVHYAKTETLVSSIYYNDLHIAILQNQLNLNAKDVLKLVYAKSILQQKSLQCYRKKR